MKHVILLIFLVVTLCFSGIVFGQNPPVAKTLQFSPAEVESMLFLYNQTNVKGADVEFVAPVGDKLRAGLEEARALKDTTQSIDLQFSATDTQVCLNIINASSFEAKYAGLVLGMKRKLEVLFPPVRQDANNPSINQQGRGNL